MSEAAAFEIRNVFGTPLCVVRLLAEGSRRPEWVASSNVTNAGLSVPSEEFFPGLEMRIRYGRASED
ncbi:hypothetical protein FRC0043_00355 [Corynebacterium belfantii]|nr:hypothetical protein AZF07_06405 [Corynebacterium diphtheriae subsp. lausannense]SNW30659.1 hypothetical protein FRC0043_00355 [Corynebacterium belfantii]